MPPEDLAGRRMVSDSTVGDRLISLWWGRLSLRRVEGIDMATASIEVSGPNAEPAEGRHGQDPAG